MNARGEQLHPGRDVVGTELSHEAVHGLLVGQDRGDRDPDREGHLGVAHGTGPAQQAHADRRRPRGEADRGSALPRACTTWASATASAATAATAFVTKIHAFASAAGGQPGRRPRRRGRRGRRCGRRRCRARLESDLAFPALGPDRGADDQGRGEGPGTSRGRERWAWRGGLQRARHGVRRQTGLSTFTGAPTWRRHPGRGIPGAGRRSFPSPGGRPRMKRAGRLIVKWRGSSRRRERAPGGGEAARRPVHAEDGEAVVAAVRPVDEAPSAAGEPGRRPARSGEAVRESTRSSGSGVRTPLSASYENAVTVERSSLIAWRRRIPGRVERRQVAAWARAGSSWCAALWGSRVPSVAAEAVRRRRCNGPLRLGRVGVALGGVEVDAVGVGPCSCRLPCSGPDPRARTDECQASRRPLRPDRWWTGHGSRRRRPATRTLPAQSCPDDQVARARGLERTPWLRERQVAWSCRLDRERAHHAPGSRAFEAPRSRLHRAACGSASFGRRARKSGGPWSSTARIGLRPVSRWRRSNAGAVDPAAFVPSSVRAHVHGRRGRASRAGAATAEAARATRATTRAGAGASAAIRPSGRGRDPASPEAASVNGGHGAGAATATPRRSRRAQPAAIVSSGGS